MGIFATAMHCQPFVKPKSAANILVFLRHSQNQTMIQAVPYANSHFFSSLIQEYLKENPKLKGLYNRFPKLENFEAQIDEKMKNYPEENRTILVNALKNQYQNISASDSTLNNIESLKDTEAFTITTGHQLNLFTGPLYFLYKIISTINLCKQLKEKYPKQNFVPIYWMATEDHDFEEINHFNFNGEKVEWIRGTTGMVGEISTNGIENALENFQKLLGESDNANALTGLFKKSYLEHKNLTEATRFLANEIFGDHGLVILDGDDRELKRLLTPVNERELFENLGFKTVNETVKKLEDFHVQVNPREINLFYLDKNIRERIVFENSRYIIYNTELSFSEDEMRELVKNSPERFSPNVIVRPIYQEIILPNLCYIGGGGEIAYWLELKSFFDANKITFPILLMRNAVLLMTEKQFNKLESLNLEIDNLFLPTEDLMSTITTDISELQMDFSQQKKFLREHFQNMYKVAEKTDKSFIGAVKAQEKKQLHGLENLEKRLRKSEKRKHSAFLERAERLQQELFPKGSLQERKSNFSEIAVDYGMKFIKELYKIDPLVPEFSIFVLSNTKI